jgi:ABC-type Mn2+/Zn2+ transport system permease subunit
MHMKRIHPQAFVLLACLALVVALTTLPSGFFLLHALKQVWFIPGHPNAGDALGHASLYGILTGVIYWALRRRVRFPWAFGIALGTALLLGLGTELIQHFSPGRTMQLSDLLGNWLGAMTVAALIGFHRSTARDE